MSDETEVEPKINIDIVQERKKARLISLLFCDFASFTKDDKVNLLGIFDRVFVHPERKQTPRFALFLRTAEATQEPIQVTVFDPHDNVILAFNFGGEEQKFALDLPAHVQLLVDIQFMASMEGVYWFDVSYEGESLGGAGLVVQFRATENKEGGTDTYI